MPGLAAVNGFENNRDCTLLNALYGSLRLGGSGANHNMLKYSNGTDHLKAINKHSFAVFPIHTFSRSMTSDSALISSRDQHFCGRHQSMVSSVYRGKE